MVTGGGTALNVPYSYEPQTCETFLLRPFNILSPFQIFFFLFLMLLDLPLMFYRSVSFKLRHIKIAPDDLYTCYITDLNVTHVP